MCIRDRIYRENRIKQTAREKARLLLKFLSEYVDKRLPSEVSLTINGTECVVEDLDDYPVIRGLYRNIDTLEELKEVVTNEKTIAEAFREAHRVLRQRVEEIESWTRKWLERVSPYLGLEILRSTEEERR